MGITIEQAFLLSDWVRRHRISGPVISLGVQHLTFTQHQFEQAVGIESGTRWAQNDANALFGTLGLHELLAADISDFEGAEIRLDLNDEDLDSTLAGRFGLVLNGGTLEHVFHVPNALTNVTRMMRPGGVVVHIVPCNNCVDHGFYQISPTLLFDYYEAAGFEILECAGFHWYPNERSAATWVKPVLPGTYGTGLLGTLGGEAVLLMFAARRSEKVVERPLPIQRLYASRGRGFLAAPRWFPPMAFVAGQPQPAPDPLSLELEAVAPAGGLAWSTVLQEELSPIGDTLANPTRSPLVLLEDERPLGPPHSDHESIRSRGGGAYSHWERLLVFSTSDGSDPRKNGRCYRAIVPRLGPLAIAQTGGDKEMRAP